jgi:hypothetical protein
MRSFVIRSRQRLKAIWSCTRCSHLMCLYLCFCTCEIIIEDLGLGYHYRTGLVRRRASHISQSLLLYQVSDIRDVRYANFLLPMTQYLYLSVTSKLELHHNSL